MAALLSTIPVFLEFISIGMCHAPFAASGQLRRPWAREEDATLRKIKKKAIHGRDPCLLSLFEIEGRCRCAIRRSRTINIDESHRSCCMDTVVEARNAPSARLYHVERYRFEGKRPS